HVIGIVVDGVPDSATLECLPAALKLKVAPDGALTQERDAVLIIDARRDGDGKRLAFDKTTAALLGQPPPTSATIDLSPLLDARSLAQSATWVLCCWVFGGLFALLGLARLARGDIALGVTV